MYGRYLYSFANLTGIPGISIPLFKHSNGMPFGLQVMTKKADELTLLELSRYLLNEYQMAEPKQYEETCCDSAHPGIPAHC